MFLQLIHRTQRFFKRLLHPHTMDSNFSWSAITDPNLYQPIAHFRQYFINYASDSQTPHNSLNRLNVIWIGLNKQREPPEHEFLVIETIDSEDKTKRFFFIDRTGLPGPATPQPAEPNSDPGRPPFGSDTASGSGSGSGRLFSNVTLTAPHSTKEPPPVSLAYRPPRHPIGDAFSLVMTKTSQAVSNSVTELTDALDRVQGENKIKGEKYGCGQTARQITPKNLKLFELVVLANVVHEFAPVYTFIDRNCFWFCNFMLDAVLELWPNEDKPGLQVGAHTKVPIDPHNTEISGRYKGWKINETDRRDLSLVLDKFRDEHRDVILRVNLFFF